MIAKKGECSECGKEGWITKPSLKLCRVCNQKRLRKNKPKKSSSGEKIVFEQIWEERERRSYLSGYPLDKYQGTDLWYNLFAHVLSKAQNKYPKYKLYKKNIILLTPHEHHLLDHGTIDQRRKYADKIGCDWSKIFNLKEELEDEYKAIGRSSDS